MAAFAGIAVAVCALTGCGSHRATTHRSDTDSIGSSAASSATGQARIGRLTIAGSYIPQPASPDVAAAYLTITNAGPTADTITRITTSVTNTVMAMNETDHGGVGTMTDLGPVVIAAHRTVSFTPGHAHLMLEHPATRLRAGEHVTFTITFEHAGRVTLTVPVQAL